MGSRMNKPRDAAKVSHVSGCWRGSSKRQALASLARVPAAEVAVK